MIQSLFPTNGYPPIRVPGSTSAYIFPTATEAWTSPVAANPAVSSPAIQEAIGPVTPTRLANGAAVVCQQMAHQPISHLSILLPVSPVYSGIRALLEDTLLNGSDATKQLIHQQNAQGITVSASPTSDRFALNLSCPAGREADMVQFAMRLLQEPQVDFRHFYRNRDKLIQNIQNMMADPSVPLSEAVMKTLYGPQHPYGRSSREVIQAIAMQTPESVLGTLRQALHYPEHNTMMMISSQPLETQKAALEQGVRSAGWSASPNRPAPLYASPLINYNRGARGPLLVPNETLTRAYIMEAWRAPTMSDPDYPAFQMMLEMLKGFSGGFFKELRTTRGLVYGVHQQLAQQKNGSGYEVMAREIDYNKDFGNIDSALEGIRHVVHRMITQGESQGRLEQAKEDFKRQLNTMKQSASGVATMNLPWLQADLMPLHPDTMRALVERVTVEDVARVANRFLNPSQGYMVLGISAPKAVLTQWQQSRSK